MALSYPVYFPSDFLSPVVAAEVVAERQFRSATGAPNSWNDWRRKPELQGAAREYVSTLVLGFARQACAAVRAGKLSSDRVGWFVGDFERRASVHAYYHLQLSGLWSKCEFFRNDVIPQIHQSDGWGEHLEDLKRCAVQEQPTQTTKNFGKDADAPHEATVATPTLPIDTSKSMTVKAAARALGVHEDTILRMGKDGRIEMFKVGRLWRVLQSEVVRVRSATKFQDR